MLVCFYTHFWYVIWIFSFLFIFSAETTKQVSHALRDFSRLYRWDWPKCVCGWPIVLAVRVCMLSIMWCPRTDRECARELRPDTQPKLAQGIEDVLKHGWISAENLLCNTSQKSFLWTEPWISLLDVHDELRGMVSRQLTRTAAFEETNASWQPLCSVQSQAFVV